MGFQLEIVTPERQFFSDEVEMVIVKGIEGDLAILENRAPLITPLTIGLIKIFEKKDGEERVAAIVDGYVTVTKEKTTVITDSAEWPEEIDEARAKEAKARAEKRLKEKESSGVDTARAEIALKRAINRLNCIKYK